MMLRERIIDWAARVARHNDPADIDRVACQGDDNDLCIRRAAGSTPERVLPGHLIEDWANGDPHGRVAAWERLGRVPDDYRERIGRSRVHDMGDA